MSELIETRLGEVNSSLIETIDDVCVLIGEDMIQPIRITEGKYTINVTVNSSLISTDSTNREVKLIIDKDSRHSCTTFFSISNVPCMMQINYNPDKETLTVSVLCHLLEEWEEEVISVITLKGRNGRYRIDADRFTGIRNRLTTRQAEFLKSLLRNAWDKALFGDEHKKDGYDFVERLIDDTENLGKLKDEE